MKLAQFSVKRPVTIFMVVLIVLLLGGVSFSKLAIDLMPDIEIPIVAVVTPYEGAGPEEVEKTVTKLYESQMASLSGVDTIISQSSAGQSMIMMEFNFGTNLDEAVNSIRERIGMFSMVMPDKVSDSTIVKMDMNSMPIMMLTVSGDRHLDDVRKIVDDTIAPRLERGDGIAAVTVSGGNEQQVEIEVDPLKLQAYGVTVDTISNLVYSENVNNSGGYVVEGDKNTLVRITGEFSSLNDIANIMIPVAQGGSVRLGELATISEKNKEITAYTKMNGKDVVAIAIQKESDGNTVQVDREVKKAIAELEADLPSDITIGYAYNQADFINVCVDSVVHTALMSVVLAMLVLLIFLRNVRSSLVIGTAIPLSVICTFVLLYFDDQTLNMLTLGGLALGIGMTVDNSIVVLENIYRHRSLGKDKITAAVDGASEVTAPVIASTLTTVAVFFPVVFVKGMASEIFTPLALTIGFALMASLVVSLTFVPMLSSKILSIKKVEENMEKKGIRGTLHKTNEACSRAFDSVDMHYGKLVRWALRHKKTVCLAVILMMVASCVLIPTIGMEFIPATDSGQINISATLPNNTVLSETSVVAERMSKIIDEVPEVKDLFLSVGGSSGMGMGSSSNSISMTVMLTPSDERSRGVDEVSNDISSRLSGIAGADITVSGADMVMSGSDPISIQIKGNKTETLRDLATEVTEIVKSVDGIATAENSFTEGVMELNVVVDRDKAAFYGVNSASVYSTLNTALQGKSLSSYKGGEDEIDMVITYPDEVTDTLEKVQQLMVPSNTGGFVPIAEVADLGYTRAQQSITRIDQSRVVTVTASIYGRDLGSISRDIQAKLDQVPLPSGYTIEFGGTSQEMMDSFADLGLALIMAILLVYMIMAAQFEGLLYPFVIMFSLPPTVIGVIIGLAVTGQTLNILSMIGMIMLAGIVVNNAIVLVDYINVLRRDHGMEKFEAIVTAGRTRLRPILMTTLTTVCGMLPQLLSSAEGSELMAPLAATIVFGLSFSTLITLILVPVMYYILDSLAARVKRLLFRNSQAEEVSVHEA